MFSNIRKFFKVGQYQNYYKGDFCRSGSGYESQDTYHILEFPNHYEVTRSGVFCYRLTKRWINENNAIPVTKKAEEIFNFISEEN